MLLAAKKTYRDAEEKYKSALEQCDYVEKEIVSYNPLLPVTERPSDSLIRF